ncbi:hypothetical protein CR513_36203, partial [Mucuna pruriens]
MCKADSIPYTRLVERGRIFKFLHGLNFEYDPIRVQVLRKEKLHLRLSEETRQPVMLDKGSSNTGFFIVTGKVMENSACIANDQDIPRIHATSFMERRKFLNEWVEIKA